MKIALHFDGGEKTSVQLIAETDAEKAILAFVTEGVTRRWQCVPSYTYRPSEVERIVLIQVPSEKQQ